MTQSTLRGLETPDTTEDESDDEDDECLCELDPDGLGCFEHYSVEEESA